MFILSPHTAKFKVIEIPSHNLKNNLQNLVIKVSHSSLNVWLRGFSTIKAFFKIICLKKKRKSWLLGIFGLCDFKIHYKVTIFMTVPVLIWVQHLLNWALCWICNGDTNLLHRGYNNKFATITHLMMCLDKKTHVFQLINQMCKMGESPYCSNKSVNYKKKAIMLFFFPSGVFENAFSGHEYFFTVWHTHTHTLTF